MNPPLPAVSVLMPVYNGERFLAEALESILGQTFREFEFVIVDDGSTDGSPPMLARYAVQDRRVRVIRQHNLGIVAALNRGLAECVAPLIARMDADDISMPTRLETQFQYMQRHSDVAVVGSSFQVISETGRCGSVMKFPESPSAVKKKLRTDNCLAHPTVMMRRAAVLESGGYREPLRHSEDYDLWTRLADKYPLANMSECLLQYRMHSQQVTSQHAETQTIRWLAARALATQRRTYGMETVALTPDIGRQFLAECGVSCHDIDKEIMLSAIGRIAMSDACGLDSQAQTQRETLWEQAKASKSKSIRRSVGARLAWYDCERACKAGSIGPAVLALLRGGAFVVADGRLARLVFARLKAKVSGCS